LPTSSRQGRERFYWFNNQYNLYLAYNLRGLCPFIYNQRDPGIEETPIGFVLNSKTKSESWKERQIRTQICLSVDRAINRPKHSVDRSVDRVQPRVTHVSRLTKRSTVILLRSTGRSTELPCARLCTPVDRAVDQPYCWLDISSGLTPFSLLLASDLCTMFPNEFEKTPSYIFIFSLPTNLHLSEDFLNLSRTHHSTCRLESACTSVAAYVPFPRDQAIRSSSKRAPSSNK